jgi:hypothetical protein
LNIANVQVGNFCEPLLAYGLGETFPAYVVAKLFQPQIGFECPRRTSGRSSSPTGQQTLAPVTICWFIFHLPRIHHELFQGF